ncbi:MAG: DEAD/DEAH box helicase [Ignavibacteriales bacterium]|nr:DEAD/DEAH box helicase [Ignavibacteriales bacterium]
MLGCAQTGTGKTAAFAIPILQLLSANKTYVQKTKGEKSDCYTNARISNSNWRKLSELTEDIRD